MDFIELTIDVKGKRLVITDSDIAGFLQSSEAAKELLYDFMETKYNNRRQAQGV